MFGASFGVAAGDQRSPAETNGIMQAELHEISVRIDAFPVSHDMNAFEQIGEDLGRVSMTSITNSIIPAEIRRAVVVLWLKWLDKIDEMIDPRFDPKDQAMLNIAPPHAAGLRSGVDPSAIKDPALREEYENALKLNKDKAERYYIQHTLRVYNKRWSPWTIRYIRRLCTSNEQEVAGIKALINANVSDAARREQLKEGIGVAK